jgi:hypothetical protein
VEGLDGYYYWAASRAAAVGRQAAVNYRGASFACAVIPDQPECKLSAATGEEQTLPLGLPSVPTIGRLPSLAHLALQAPTGQEAPRCVGKRDRNSFLANYPRGICRNRTTTFTITHVESELLSRPMVKKHEAGTARCRSSCPRSDSFGPRQTAWCCAVCPARLDYCACPPFGFCPRGASSHIAPGRRPR